MADSDEILRRGVVIPAHPLALTADRRLDERRQVALTRYYCDAGAGGVAVGVHTTQFAIREASLLRPVLALAAETVRAHEAASGRRLLKVSGVCGPTAQAVAEATLARDLGYDLGLLSLGALRDAPTDDLLAHARAVGERHPPVRVLSPARGRRPGPRLPLLAGLPGDRRGARHQGGALQPLRDPRGGPGPGRKRTCGRGGSVHGQRRRDRGRPRGRLRLRRWRPRGLRRRPPGPMGGVDAEGRGFARRGQEVAAERRQGHGVSSHPGPSAHRRERRVLRRPQRASPGASRVSTRSCAARVS